MIILRRVKTRNYYKYTIISSLFSTWFVIAIITFPFVATRTIFIITIVFFVFIFRFFGALAFFLFSFLLLFFCWLWWWLIWPFEFISRRACPISNSRKQPLQKGINTSLLWESAVKVLPLEKLVCQHPLFCQLFYHPQQHQAARLRIQPK